MVTVPLKYKLIISGVVAMLVFGAGCWTGWRLRKPLIGTAMPTAQINLPDGSIVAGTTVDPTAKPVMQVPSGQTVLHQGQIKVVPSSSGAAKVPTSGAPLQGGNNPGASLPATPTTIDWALLQDQQGQDHLEVKSPDGTITSVTDVVVRPNPVIPDRPWAAGVLYGVSTTGKDYGAWVERDLSRLRVGLEGIQSQQFTGRNEFRVNARVGWRFSF